MTDRSDAGNPRRMSRDTAVSLPDRPLSAHHREHLRASGLTDETMAASGLYTETDGDEVRALLGEYLSIRTARALGPCLVFPYLGPDGRPVEYIGSDGRPRPFVRLRPDRPRNQSHGRRNGQPRAVKYESPARSGCRAYLPPGTRSVLSDPALPLLITEGEKKALCADQHGLPCIGLGGVWAWQVARPEDASGRKTGPRELIPDLDEVAWAGRRVTIVFDSDTIDPKKPDVQWGRWFLVEALRDRGATVRVVDLPAGEAGAKVGLDDYVLAHSPAALRQLIAAAADIEPVRPQTGDPRPVIVVGTDEYRVNTQAASALADQPDLFQRGGLLVQLVRQTADIRTGGPASRPEGSPVLRDLPRDLLRERMTRAARWVRVSGSEESPIHPPAWSVAAVHSRGVWPRVRPLEAVVTHPVILPDGSILAESGYDRRSGLLLSVPGSLRIMVPDEPTSEHVAAAVATLTEVVSDFPFDAPAHRSAWLAALLTPIAWFAFDGLAPLFLVDGNVRGVGKGLLADVIAIILTGRRFPVMGYTADREELRKAITSLAMEGERLVLLDNLTGAVGSDVLDRALTAERWKDRVLGTQRVYDGPLNIVWYATGNNVQLVGDTPRRVCRIRLQSAHERPEERTDVTHADLRSHVRASRGALLSAALTILRGWFAAGRPRHTNEAGEGLTPWGSFESWSAVVREALVSAGLPDPGLARMSLDPSADRESQALAALMDALESMHRANRMDVHTRGVTCGEIAEAVCRPPEPIPEEYRALREAVEELCGPRDERRLGPRLGYRLRGVVQRNIGGRMIHRAGTAHASSSRWIIRPAENWNRPEPSPPSPPSPPGDTARDGGDGGDGGDGSGRPEMADDEERAAIREYGGG